MNPRDEQDRQWGDALGCAIDVIKTVGWIVVAAVAVVIALGCWAVL